MSESHANVNLVDYQVQPNGSFKAELDNGCYVIRVPDASLENNGNMRLCCVIGANHGARQISQYVAVVETGTSPVMRYPGSDVVLFIVSGLGNVTIGHRDFPVSAQTGVCIKPGEAFTLTTTGAEAMVLNISVCPQCATPEFLIEMTNNFEASIGDRVQGVDLSKRETMGDRFYQVLIDDEHHGTPVTQFIGEIPLSRAAHHHHPYEETITVLNGEGFMWTDKTKAQVQPGDTIFLPRTQTHSLESTSKNGMRLVGLFYPSMSPATSY